MITAIFTRVVLPWVYMFMIYCCCRGALAAKTDHEIALCIALAIGVLAVLVTQLQEKP